MPTAKPKPSVYQLKITLLEIEPAIWWRIQVPSTIPLCCVHDALQAVFGWTDSHLHQFEKDGRYWGVPDDDGFEGDVEVIDESRDRWYSPLRWRLRNSTWNGSPAAAPVFHVAISASRSSGWTWASQKAENASGEAGAAPVTPAAVEVGMCRVDTLSKITVPALILKQGAPPETRRATEEAVKVLKNGKLAHLDGGGDNHHHESQAVTVEVLKPFSASTQVADLFQRQQAVVRSFPWLIRRIAGG